MFAIGCSYFASRMQKANSQRQAVEAIRDGHAYFYHQWKWDQPSTASGVGATEEIGYRWARDLLGDDFFFNIDSAVLNHASDKDLECLGGFPSLRRLDITWPEITDAGLEHVRDLTNIEALDLNVFFNDGANVTDAGLRNLSGLTQLRFLNLGCTNVSGEGLVHLSGLMRLEELGLTKTRVADDGLRYLNGLRSMRRLYLSDTKITDDGLSQLDGMEHLEILDLSGTAITDACPVSQNPCQSLGLKA